MSTHSTHEERFYHVASNKRWLRDGVGHVHPARCCSLSPAQKLPFSATLCPQPACPCQSPAQLPGSARTRRCRGSARNGKPRVARERDQKYRNKMIQMFGVSKGRLSSDAAARRSKKPGSGTMVGL